MREDKSERIWIILREVSFKCPDYPILSGFISNRINSKSSPAESLDKNATRGPPAAARSSAAPLGTTGGVELRHAALHLELHLVLPQDLEKHGERVSQILYVLFETTYFLINV